MRTNTLERLSLNLANTFTSNTELFPYLLKRVIYPIFKSVTKFQNFTLFWRKLIKNFSELISKNTVCNFLIRRDHTIIFHKVSEYRLAITIIIPDRTFK